MFFSSNSRKNSLNNTWSTAPDSASSSDESSNNGESALSMGLGLSGQNLLHSVSRRWVFCLLVKPYQALFTLLNVLDPCKDDLHISQKWTLSHKCFEIMPPQNLVLPTHSQLSPQSESFMMNRRKVPHQTLAS